MLDTRPSAAQVERLALLMEECEAQQVIGKILRHGWEFNGHLNRIALEHELGDLLWAIGLLEREDDINGEAVARFQDEKPAKAAPYLHYNEAS